MLEVVERYRDRVLDGAGLRPGMTLADVGAGDGLIAFGAIARIGSSLRVILTDISTPLLRHAEERAVQMGTREQCSFVQGSADKLEGLSDASVDVVCTRASLAYVADKSAAFREFHRVLKPGGRISISEPILQDEAFEACGMAKLVESKPDHPNIEWLRLVSRYRAAQFPTTQEEVLLNPITNYNERDLFRFTREAGFVNNHLEMHMDMRPSLAITWEAYLDVARHPWAPTLREILDRDFSAEERRQFERMMRPAMESGSWEQREVSAYLTAAKSLKA
ncbi:MAG TPA: methyltransferase domain-containing protein [Tepidisphaeraceae bacterium]|nr:methyltransferase domain-containing protein [Tepidisphaeraceae bacterium]